MTVGMPLFISGLPVLSVMRTIESTGRDVGL